LHTTRVISDSTWGRLCAELTIEQRVELCFLVGNYEMLAMTLNSLGVEPESSALAKLDSTAAALAARLAEHLRGTRLASP
jgi:hypothetical protein